MRGEGSGHVTLYVWYTCSGHVYHPPGRMILEYMLGHLPIPYLSYTIVFAGLVVIVGANFQ